MAGRPKATLKAQQQKADAQAARLAEAWYRTEANYIGGYAVPQKPGARHWPSIEEAATREGLLGLVGIGNIRQRASRGSWREKQEKARQAYQTELDAAVHNQLTQRAQSLAVQKMESNDEDFALGRSLRAKIAQGLSALQMQEIYEGPEGQTRVRIPRGAAYYLAQLSQAALNVQRVTRLASGQSTDNVSTRDGRSEADEAEEMLADLMLEVERHAELNARRRPSHTIPSRNGSGNGSAGH